MNIMHDLQRVVANASKVGYFRRDQQGNEHELSGYIVELTHQAKVRGQEETVTKTEMVVCIAASTMEAKVIASRPYNEAKIVSVDARHLNNPTLMRIVHPEK